ncbi:hypothetical protein BJX96DRAFT_147024 [Aspergillus floccosus]
MESSPRSLNTRTNPYGQVVQSVLYFLLSIAMRRGDRLSATADIKKSQEQFRTPDRVFTAGAGGKASQSKAPSTLTRGTGTPGSSFSTSRSWRRDTFPLGSHDQPTLTQIDFVTPISQNPPSDDGLDYIPESKLKPNDVIEIEDDSDDNDADYRPPSHKKPRRSRGDRSEQGTTSRDPQKKTTTQSDTKRGRRKSSEKLKSGRKDKVKKEKEQHKTLTQMDYVRRYLKIEPDDEVKLEYTYITPKKDEPGTSDHKRRRVDNTCPREQTKNPADDKKAAVSRNPTTPKKHKMAEIPSSQSPESPGLAVISSSQFRHAARSPRSPLKRLGPSTADHRIKEESPELGSTKMRAQSPEMGPLPSSASQQTPKVPSSSPSHEVAIFPKAHIDALGTQYPSEEEGTRSIQEAVYVDEAKPQRSHTSRTVVYETDADTDYGESDNDVPSPVGDFPDNDYTHFGSDDMANGDSLDLPPVTPTQRHNGTEIPGSETNLPSDASIFYQRLQPTTQIPMEPLPDLNTQKLAELFPETSNPYDTSAVGRFPQSSLATSRVQSGTTQTQTQTQSQSQSQSQDLDQTPAEIVPESSPIMRNGSERHQPIDKQQESQGRDAVVQVESSQAVDRAFRQASMRQKPRSRGILSGSDLLTSSVMESVPLPAFWFGSQDSVGEPYNSPEA